MIAILGRRDAAISWGLYEQVLTAIENQDANTRRFVQPTASRFLMNSRRSCK